MTAAVDAKERILEAAQQLVMERGFSATTVDAILEAAGASKGAFFHHFSSKADLGRVLVERYAHADGELLEHLMAVAESRTSDPAEQLIEFVAAFEEGIEDLSLTQPGCLFVSFVYEQFPGQDETRKLILDDVLRWRARILEKLRLATERRPPPWPSTWRRLPIRPSRSSRAGSSSLVRPAIPSSSATSSATSAPTSRSSSSPAERRLSGRTARAAPRSMLRAVR